MKGRPDSALMRDALLQCLADVPFCTVEATELQPDGPHGRPDLLVLLRLPRANQLLIVECKQCGQPRLARAAVNQLLRCQRDYPGAYAVFMAPYVSPRAAAICRDEGVGYLDLAGNGRLCFANVFIHRDGRPNKFIKRRDLRSLYAPKATRVLRVLLHNPRRSWRQVALAREAQVSVGQTSNVKKLLADREWIRTSPDGISLTDPAALLAEWSENYSYRRNTVHNYYSLSRVVAIEADLARAADDAGFTYALTGLSAAARMAPAVRYQRVTAYVRGDPGEAARRLDLKEVSSGANVILLSPYDDGVFYGAKDIGGVVTASAVQTYLDVKGYAGRGREAADALLVQVIRPTW